MSEPTILKNKVNYVLKKKTGMDLLLKTTCCLLWRAQNTHFTGEGRRDSLESSRMVILKGEMDDYSCSMLWSSLVSLGIFVIEII